MPFNGLHAKYIAHHSPHHKKHHIDSGKYGMIDGTNETFSTSQQFEPFCHNEYRDIGDAENE